MGIVIIIIGIFIVADTIIIGIQRLRVIQRETIIDIVDAIIIIIGIDSVTDSITISIKSTLGV